MRKKKRDISAPLLIKPHQASNDGLPKVLLSPDAVEGESHNGNWDVSALTPGSPKLSIAISESIDYDDTEQAHSPFDVPDSSPSLSELRSKEDDNDLDWDFTWADCCLQPLAWLSRVIYILAVLYGFVAFIIIFLHQRSLIPDSVESNKPFSIVFSDACIAGYLILATIVATYEIHALGSLEEIIGMLSKEVDQLNAQIIGLEVSVTKTVKTLNSVGSSINKFDRDNALLKAETSSSSSSVTSLRTGHARIVAENKALEERMANMMRRNVKLRDSVANYQSVVDEAAQQITKLSRLRQSISRVAAEHSDHQHDVLKQYQDRLERMNELKKYQQRLILQQISYRAEFKDQQVGFSKREFQHFFRTLPKKYSNIVATKSWKFDELKNSDGIVTRATIDDIIDRLVDSYEGEEPCDGGGIGK